MAEKSNRIYLLEEAGVASALLKLGIPTMIGMLISALYNAIDAYFVGKAKLILYDWCCWFGFRFTCYPYS